MSAVTFTFYDAETGRRTGSVRGRPVDVADFLALMASHASDPLGLAAMLGVTLEPPASDA